MKAATAFGMLGLTLGLTGCSSSQKEQSASAQKAAPIPRAFVVGRTGAPVWCSEMSKSSALHQLPAAVNLALEGSPSHSWQPRLMDAARELSALQPTMDKSTASIALAAMKQLNSTASTANPSLDQLGMLGKAMTALDVPLEKQCAFPLN